MAEVIWTISSLNDLETILEFIELDDEEAAKRLARKVFEKTDRLSAFPNSGSKPKELIGTPYRRQVVGPILIYHRLGGNDVYIVHVRRGEMRFSLRDIVDRDK
jgi:plasmid stabilization system protein ParE